MFAALQGIIGLCNQCQELPSDFVQILVQFVKNDILCDEK